jgi:hypothetical protein
MSGGRTSSRGSRDLTPSRALSERRATLQINIYRSAAKRSASSAEKSASRENGTWLRPLAGASGRSGHTRPTKNFRDAKRPAADVWRKNQFAWEPESDSVPRVERTKGNVTNQYLPQRCKAIGVLRGKVCLEGKRNLAPSTRGSEWTTLSKMARRLCCRRGMLRSGRRHAVRCGNSRRSLRGRESRKTDR